MSHGSNELELAIQSARKGKNSGAKKGKKTLKKSSKGLEEEYNLYITRILLKKLGLFLPNIFKVQIQLTPD